MFERIKKPYYAHTPIKNIQKELGNLFILCLFRYHQHMAFVAQCGGEDIGFTAIFQLQALAQFGYREGEVAGGDVRLGDS